MDDTFGNTTNVQHNLEYEYTLQLTFFTIHIFTNMEKMICLIDIHGLYIIYFLYKKKQTYKQQITLDKGDG